MKQEERVSVGANKLLQLHEVEKVVGRLLFSPLKQEARTCCRREATGRKRFKENGEGWK